MSIKLDTILPFLVAFIMLLGSCVQQTEKPSPDVPHDKEPAVEEPTATKRDCTSPDVFCVGLVTNVGEVFDNSSNQSAWEGVEEAGRNLGAIIKYVETKEAKDYSSNIELFADQDFDVIVTVGGALSEITLIEAAKYLNVKFIGVNQIQDEVMDNVAGLIFPEDRLGFLAGALAALMSESETIAAVLGTDQAPQMVAFKEGYEAGAKYINPDINLIATYHPGGLDVAFDDPEWGATTAKQTIDQGADVIFGAGSRTGSGALIEAAANAGIYCIGVDSDQWLTVAEAHPCLVSSAMKLITQGVYGLIEMAYEGRFPSGNFVGQVGLALFHDLDSHIPREVKNKLAEVEAGSNNGSIVTSGNPGD